jgi:hypothetical protein
MFRFREGPGFAPAWLWGGVVATAGVEDSSVVIEKAASLCCLSYSLDSSSIGRIEFPLEIVSRKNAPCKQRDLPGEIGGVGDYGNE